MIKGMTESLQEASPQLIDEVKNLAGDISNAMTPEINGSYAMSNAQTNFNSMVEAFKEALSEMKIELDDAISSLGNHIVKVNLHKNI